jgi:hypothetical protein
MHYLLCLTNDDTGYAPARPADGYHLVGPFNRDVDAQHYRASLIGENRRLIGPRVHLLNLRPGEAYRPPCLQRLDGTEGQAEPGIYLARTGILPGALLFTGRLRTGDDLAGAYAAARIGGVDPLNCLIWMNDALLHQPPVIVSRHPLAKLREVA